MEEIESKTLTRRIHAHFKKNDQKLGLSCDQIRFLFVFTFKVAKTKDKFHLSVYTAWSHKSLHKLVLEIYQAQKWSFL